MRCERKIFRYGSKRIYYSCPYKARVNARIPFATGHIEYKLCRKCLEERSDEVFFSRGATVTSEDL